MDESVDREDAGDLEAGHGQAVYIVCVDHVGREVVKKLLDSSLPPTDGIDEDKPGLRRKAMDGKTLR